MSLLSHYPHARWLLIPAALACMLLALTACSPFTLLNGAIPENASRVTADIAYGDALRQRLDVYAPPDAALAPVVVFFYGGSWRSGSRKDYAFVGDALASRGIVAVLADYRLYPEAAYPVFLRDSARAVAWTLRHAADIGGDPRRVYVAGHSAGAYNAAMIALDPRWLAELGASPDALAGWIGMAGPYDFLPIETRSVRPVFHYPDTPADSQPVAHATRGAPRTLLMTGMADTLVDPVRNTGHLEAALRAAGTPLTVVRYPNLGHRLLAGALARPLRWRAPVLDDLAGFVLAGRQATVEGAAAGEDAGAAMPSPATARTPGS
ncbi:esterase/lipase [Bordetella ansorpii]|uniref:Esterase/lipase n=1 Tax=Bordetella ansorpii TaxID=288768 RepID=A0A157SGX4_9BORD|nr:alpha/beta hydrolase [Bordetella ansorpii]SAI69443.1 esterase/lipase [Bordetella ansorpii]